MHNYFFHKKINQENDQKEEQSRKHDSYMRNKKQKDGEMVERFVRRTKLSLYKQINQGSCQVQKYRDPKYQPRASNPTRRIGPPSFYFQDRSSRQRVNDAINRNLNLDEIPFNSRSSPTSHRFRQKSSDESFKFTSYDTTSRVLQSVKQQQTNVIESSWNLNLSRYTQKIHRRNRSTYQLQRIKQSRQILPTLTVKHHPKTLESIQNTINVGVLRSTALKQITPSLYSNIQPTTLPLHKQQPPNKIHNQNQMKKIKKKNLNHNVRFSTVHVNGNQRQQKGFELIN